MRLRHSIVALVTVVVAVALAPAAAAARVPQGFVGVMVDGPLFDPQVDLRAELDTMVASGVESVRVVFAWSAAQPYATFADVPPGEASSFADVGGVPTQWAATDRIVALAAARRLTVLPVVVYAPPWDAVVPGSPSSPPASPGPYAAFMTAVVDRYGPHGTFWAENPAIPKRPIRVWQVWNEPNIVPGWSAQPSVHGYVRLLRAAHAAIKAADPGAEIVLAGLPNYSWQYLAQVYRVPGARRVFDVVAIHPYTSAPQGVVEILGLARRVMNRNGDVRKPMLVTEMGWPSSLGKLPKRDLYGFETTEAAQARKLAAELPLLAAARRRLDLLGFYLYTWMGDEYPGAFTFNFSGLFAFRAGRIVTKPAYAAFRRAALALDGCRTKGPIATVCLASSSSGATGASRATPRAAVARARRGVRAPA